MKNIMRDIISRRQQGELCGIPSFCTANPIVIAACMRVAKELGQNVLIEATANQVNQFGGYTGMQPADFRDMVFGIAAEVGFPKENIVLGGDHLGPLTWVDLPEEEAMSRSKELVRTYVKAGFKKIHLDTSMRLSCDDPSVPLSDDIIARRGAMLYAECKNAYRELLRDNPDELCPTFIIGSEVPIPGGAQESEDALAITRPESLRSTLEAYRNAFESIDEKDAFGDIIGIVVQPGVEFGDEICFRYDSHKAGELIAEAKKNFSVVLEGHSTDYQTPEDLRNMVKDGLAILKVGPALTYALREGLFALSMMEKELFGHDKNANFPDVLESAMLEDPSKWKKYYHGNDMQIRLCRKYSYSDRSRYYLTVDSVKTSIYALLDNMETVKIPLTLIHQYMPMQYERIIRGKLDTSAYALVTDYVANVVRGYYYAAVPDLDIAGILF